MSRSDTKNKCVLYADGKSVQGNSKRGPKHNKDCANNQDQPCLTAS